MCGQKCGQDDTKNSANALFTEFSLAEKEGFEPSMSYQPIHEFQSCAINRARRLLLIEARDLEARCKKYICFLPATIILYQIFFDLSRGFCKKIPVFTIFLSSRIFLFHISLLLGKRNIRTTPLLLRSTCSRKRADIPHITWKAMRKLCQKPRTNCFFHSALRSPPWDSAFHRSPFCIS